MTEQVAIETDGDDVLVRGSGLLSDRTARLFFLGSLGATETKDGWRCPRRRISLSNLVVRVNTYLENKGWKVTRDGISDESVQMALERKLSFTRTREAASQLLEGKCKFDINEIRKALAAFGWNSKNRDLRPHQETGLIHALTSGSAANFSVPGAGKTATTLAVAATHLASKTVDLVLVVGPLSCFAPWENESTAALGGNLKSRRVRGTSEQRRAQYAKVRPGDLVLVSYASAATDKHLLVELCKIFKVMFVADESHRVKRFKGGTWAPAMMEIARTARVRMILSGTPMPQSGRDLYSQLNILWPDGQLTGPRDEFASRVEKDFPALLDDIRPFMRRTPKSALGLTPYKVIRHDVPMAAVQSEIYSLIESQFRRVLAGMDTWKEKIEALRRARPIRLLQAATNPEILNRKDSNYKLPRIESPSASLMDRLSQYKEIEVPGKIDFGLDLVKGLAGEGKKVVCWSNFIGNLDAFSDAVRALGIPCFQVDGRVAAGTEASNGDTKLIANEEEPETREQVIEKFLGLEGAAVLVANPASCSESISLHRSCWVAIYLDRTYDCAHFLQSIDRIHRLGLPAGVEVQIHILNATLGAHPTIDHLVNASLIRKEEAMLRLLQGAEPTPLEESDDLLKVAEGDEEDLLALLRYLLGEAP